MAREEMYSVLHGETYVNQEVTTATGDEERRCRREDDGDLASVHNSISNWASWGNKFDCITHKDETDV